MHILIVEDDPVVADVLGMTLEEAGHFQTTVHNIETALAELKHNAIDVVLLDIDLPDGDGTRLARLIRKNYMPGPILVVSGNASTDDKIAALGAGADGYLTKPFDRFELLANLDAIIRRTHGHSSATVSVGNLEVDLNRHRAATAPNLIHSLDASLLHLSIDKFDKPIALIHDSVLTQSVDMDELSAIIRETYMHLFAEHDYLNDFAQQIGAETEPPIIGDLQPESVIDSTYFFC